MSSNTEFATLLDAFLSENFDGLSIGDTQPIILKFLEESGLSIPTKAAKVSKVKDVKTVTEKKVRRSSAAKEADEIFSANPGKVIIIKTEGSPTIVAINNAGDAKKIGAEIKSAIKGKGISAKTSDVYGPCLSIPEKNADDQLMEDVCEILGKLDIEFVHHTRNKVAKPLTAYNIFMRKARAENSSLTLTEISKMWNASDEKKQSTEIAEQKKAEKKAESEKKKAEKKAETEKKKAEKAAAAAKK